MFGPILVVLGVCAIVAVYMCVVHRFLRASEESESEADDPELSAAKVAHAPTLTGADGAATRTDPQRMES